MFGLNTGSITDDKQLRFKKDLAILASLKNKKSFPSASVSLFQDPVDAVNLFNTNLSFHSIDKNNNRYGLLDPIGSNYQNENMNNTNKSNLSFSLFPYHFQNDTLLSFNLDTPKDMDQYFPIHKTNESFVYNLATPLQTQKQPQSQSHQLPSLFKVEDEQQMLMQQAKEDSLMSTQKQTQLEGELTLVQDYEVYDADPPRNVALANSGIAAQSNSNKIRICSSSSNINNKTINKVREKGGTKPECLHENCDFVFRTLKQKLAHHHKMSPECKKDSILLLTSIKNLKQLLRTMKKKKKLNVTNVGYKYLLTKYERIMRNLSLTEHVELLTGYSIENEM